MTTNILTMIRRQCAVAKVIARNQSSEFNESSDLEQSFFCDGQADAYEKVIHMIDKFEAEAERMDDVLDKGAVR